MLNKFTIQKSFAISAGAGSGKTYTLSRRYINAILGFDFFVEKEIQNNFFENYTITKNRTSWLRENLEDHKNRFYRSARTFVDRTLCKNRVPVILGAQTRSPT